MALLFLEGFETYNGITGLLNNALSKKWDARSGTNTLNSGGRINTSGYYLAMGSNGAIGKLVNDTGFTTIITGVALRFSSTPASFYNTAASAFMRIYDASSQPGDFLYPTSVGDATAWKVGDQSFTMTGFTFGDWYYIETKSVFVSSTTWTVTIKINGEQVFNSTSDLAINNIRQISFATPINSGSVTTDIDDIYICDSTGSVNNNFIYKAHLYTIESVIPNATGFYQQWITRPPADNHYSSVATDDQDDSKVYSCSDGEMDSYLCSNISFIKSTIAGIAITTLAKNSLPDDDTILRIFTRIGGTDYMVGDHASPFLGPVNYSGRSTIVEKNPATDSAWTVSDINALEIGVKDVFPLPPNTIYSGESTPDLGDWTTNVGPILSLIGNTVQVDDPSLLTSLDITDGVDGIFDLTICSNLTSFTCNNQYFTSADFSGLTSLSTLSITNNSYLTTLNISGCTGLTTLTCNGLPNVTVLDVTGANGLTYLNCNGSPLSTLDLVGKSALTYLNCTETASVDATTCPALETLYCGGANLTSLSITGLSNLDYLNSPYAEITSLDFTGCSALTQIYCPECKQLTSVDLSPSPLLISVNFGCSPGVNGLLSSIDLTGLTSLADLTLYGQSFTTIDTSPASALTSLYIDDNSLTTIDVSSNSALTYFSCSYNSLTSIDTTGLTSLLEYYCNNNSSLGSIDVSTNTALTNFNCAYDGLTTLDVSTNTDLVELNCGNNSITSLDVSSNTSLSNLTCSFNSMTTLNLTGVNNLTYLYCDNNNLTTFDITGASSLDTLICNNNSLSGLNLSGNGNLNQLDCSYDTLTTLDLSACSNLNELHCQNNSITSLDLSVTNNIYSVDCSYNTMTSLDLTDATNLYELHCDNNNLTTLTLTDTSNLSLLYCNDNSISSLDLSDATNISEVYCNDNSMTSLDTTDDTNLGILYCNDNSLTSIDVSTNSNLYELHCDNNSFTALDISGATNLNEVYCDNNSITSLDVSANINLNTLYCNDNAITTLNVLGANALYNLYAQVNSMNSTAVDTVLADLVTNNYNTNGTVNLTSNTAPSGAGLASKATLEGYGWTVLVD